MRVSVSGVTEAIIALARRVAGRGPALAIVVELLERGAAALEPRQDRMERGDRRRDPDTLDAPVGEQRLGEHQAAGPEPEGPRAGRAHGEEDLLVARDVAEAHALPGQRRHDRGEGVVAG